MDNVRRHYGDRHGDKLQYARLPLEALDGADALAIVTEWTEFRHPDFDELARRMKGRVIFDGRNLYKPEDVVAAGFTYHCIGKVIRVAAG